MGAPRPADQINPYEYNPEKAKELLVAAGCEYQGDTLYLNGEPVTLDFIHPTGNANVEKIAVVIQQNLKDIGHRRERHPDGDGQPQRADRIRRL